LKPAVTSPLIVERRRPNIWGRLKIKKGKGVGTEKGVQKNPTNKRLGLSSTVNRAIKTEEKRTRLLQRRQKNRGKKKV